MGEIRRTHMEAAVVVDWDEMRRAQVPRVRVDEQLHAVQLARENMRLLEDNERLRRENADLAASAEIWIRLYEAALARATQPLVALRGTTTRQ